MTLVGVLDSGVGGLSVLREIHRLLPDVSTAYFADQGHVPYGPRSHDEIHQFVNRITQILLDEVGAEVIVLACHAASAASLYRLREAYPQVPFVGIEPAVKPAAQKSRKQVIGVLTTQATADGLLYRRVVERFAADVTVITQVSPELVQIVEAGDIDTPQGRAWVESSVRPLIDSDADEIVLACTHFPFLMDAIRAVIPSHIELIDPGPAVARQVARVLGEGSSMQTPATHRYFTSGDLEAFNRVASLLMEMPISAEYIDLNPAL